VYRVAVTGVFVVATSWGRCHVPARVHPCLSPRVSHPVPLPRATPPCYSVSPCHSVSSCQVGRLAVASGTKRDGAAVARAAEAIAVVLALVSQRRGGERGRCLCV